MPLPLSPSVVRFLVPIGCALAVAGCATPVPTRTSVPPAPAPATTTRPEKGPTTDLPADLLFTEGTAELTADGRARVQALATELLSRGDVFVVVRGYTDDDGSAAFNIALSEDRAFCVRDLLVAEGLSPDRVLARGLGPRFPVGDNRTAEDRARNRRISVEVRPDASH